MKHYIYTEICYFDLKKDLKVLRDAFFGHERDKKTAWFSDLLTLKRHCAFTGVKWGKVLKTRYVNRSVTKIRKGNLFYQKSI